MRTGPAASAVAVVVVAVTLGIALASRPTEPEAVDETVALPDMTDLGQPGDVASLSCLAPVRLEDCVRWERPWVQSLRAGVAGDTVMLVDGMLVRGFDVETGQQVWSAEATGVVDFEWIAVVDEGLVVVDRKGSTAVMDRRGRIRWTVPGAPTLLGVPFVPSREAILTGAPSRVDFRSVGSDRVQLRSLRDGELLWATDVAGAGPVRAFPGWAGIVVNPIHEDQLLLLDAQDGHVVWAMDHGGNVVGMTDRHLVMLEQSSDDDEQSARLVGVDLQAGHTLWDRTLEQPLPWPPRTTRNHVLVGTVDGGVIALEAASGRLAWTRSAPVADVVVVEHGPGEVGHTASADAGVVILRTPEGRLVGLEEPSGHEVWRSQRDGFSRARVHGNRLFAEVDDHLTIREITTGDELARTDLPAATVLSTEPLLITGNDRLVRLANGLGAAPGHRP